MTGSVGWKELQLLLTIAHFAKEKGEFFSAREVIVGSFWRQETRLWALLRCCPAEDL